MLRLVVLACIAISTISAERSRSPAARQCEDGPCGIARALDHLPWGSHKVSARAERAAGFCDYEMYYDRWLPSFVPGEFQHPGGGASAGAHCLEHCCKDPTCAGVAIDSSLEGQCYRYDKVPEGLGSEHQPLSSFLLGTQPPVAWSVAVRASAPGQVGQRAAASGVGASVAPALEAALEREESARPAVLSEAAQKERALDASLHALPSPKPAGSCEWSVHYDTWAPSFNRGEYEHPGALGGAHCLEVCCNDPSCVGLEMMSSELYQCYKYGKAPEALVGHEGRPLGDGAWLRHKRPAWSVLVKKLLSAAAADVAADPFTGQAGGARPPSARWDPGPGPRPEALQSVGSSLLLLAMVLAVAGLLCAGSGDQLVRQMGKLSARARSDPAAAKLMGRSLELDPDLQGPDPKLL